MTIIVMYFFPAGAKFCDGEVDPNIVQSPRGQSTDPRNDPTNNNILPFAFLSPPHAQPAHPGQGSSQAQACPVGSNQTTHRRSGTIRFVQCVQCMPAQFSCSSVQSSLDFKLSGGAWRREDGFEEFDDDSTIPIAIHSNRGETTSPVKRGTTGSMDMGIDKWRRWGSPHHRAPFGAVAFDPRPTKSMTPRANRMHSMHNTRMECTAYHVSVTR